MGKPNITHKYKKLSDKLIFEVYDGKGEFIARVRPWYDTKDHYALWVPTGENGRLQIVKSFNSMEDVEDHLLTYGATLYRQQMREREEQEAREKQEREEQEAREKQKREEYARLNLRYGREDLNNEYQRYLALKVKFAGEG